jgi:hypothetical protein
MIILWVLLILIGLPVVMAFIPVFYKADAAYDKGLYTHIRIIYLLFYLKLTYDKGRFDLTVRFAGLRLKKIHKKAAKQAAAPLLTADKSENCGAIPQRHKKSGFFRKNKAITRWKNKGPLLTSPNLKIMIGLFMQWLVKFAKTLMPKKIKVNGIIGTGDPYYTGLLLGFYEAVAGCLRIRENVCLTADFNQPVLSVSLAASGHMSFAELIWPTLWICLQKPMRKIIKGYFH